MLDKIKILLGILTDDKDELLAILISICKDEAKEYCNLSDYSSDLDSAVIQMVIERYNKIGTEGLKSSSSSGVSENYLESYSLPILMKLRKHRKVRAV